MLSDAVKSGEITGRHGETLILNTMHLIKPAKVLIAGLGPAKDLSPELLRQAGGMACTALQKTGKPHIALASTGVDCDSWLPEEFVEGFLLKDYRFERYKKSDLPARFKRMTILSAKGIASAIRRAEVISKAAAYSRDLVNTPSNDLTPSDLADEARSIKDTTVRVITRKQAEKLGMGAYTAVARGSHEEPKFIVITYKKKNTAPLVLIGKSITFDSGGISLKPASGMERMKYDMAGGAAVLGVMKALTLLRMPVHVVAILPATENLPGGSASKPGDVVRTMCGKTVEIISTDAEGRLVLADAICFAKKLRPSAIINIATLTGACSIALGNEAAALMGNNNSLIKSLEEASDKTGERVWHMPLFDEYRDYLKSEIADMKNSSGRSASLVTAGYFLKEFVGPVPWAHIDIAGTAWTDKDKPCIPQGATGMGVRLLMKAIENMK